MFCRNIAADSTHRTEAAALVLYGCILGLIETWIRAPVGCHLNLHKTDAETLCEYWTVSAARRFAHIYALIFICGILGIFPNNAHALNW